MLLWVGFSVGQDSSVGRKRVGRKREIRLVLPSLTKDLLPSRAQ